MALEHEFIEYPEKMLPVNWIFHHYTDVSATVLPHWHESIEISYTHRGQIDNYIIGGESFTTEKNDILIMNPMEVHSVFSNSTGVNAALTIQISLQFVKQLIPDLEFKRFVIHPTADSGKAKEHAQLLECLQRFYIEAQEPKIPYANIQMMGTIYELIYLLARDWMHEVDYGLTSTMNDKKLGKVESMIHYIEENYAEELSIEGIADHFHISPYYVSKLFKNKLNIGVMTYVQLVRVRAAQELLLTTDKPIQVISDLVGFPNEKSFRTVFKKIFGVTPKKYQLNNQRNG